jgi:hypothetical protein
MKAVRRVAVLMAVCACVSAIACSRQEAQGPSESAVGKPVATPEPVEAPTHSHDLQPIPEGLRILSEEKADSHGSARLKLLVSVPRETTRSQMRKLFAHSTSNKWGDATSSGAKSMWFWHGST